VFDIPFAVSGSILLTALSRSKGYRTMNGMQTGDLLRRHQYIRGISPMYEKIYFAFVPAVRPPFLKAGAYQEEKN
jgi:hypothetical protein